MKNEITMAASPSPTLRPGLSETRRKQILLGARTVFVEDGFEGASVDRIAKEAGVSKGTLYNYFDSKESLFISLIQSECNPSDFQRDMSAIADDPVRLLTEIGKAFMGHLLKPEEMGIFRIVLAEAAKFPELGRRLEQSGPGAGAHFLSMLLAEFHRQGKLTIPDCRLAAEQFMGMCDAGAIRRLQLTAEIPQTTQIVTQVDSAVRLFLKGYAPT